jgi:hypothetical protein
VVHGDGLKRAQLDPAMGAATGAVQHRDPMPGEPGAPVVQGRLVGLDDEQVMRVLGGDEELCMLVLGVQRVSGDDRAGKVEAAQQRLEPGDLAWAPST